MMPPQPAAARAHRPAAQRAGARSLGWPRGAEASMHMGEADGKPRNVFEGAAAAVSVQTLGTARAGTHWYDEKLGFFPDGEPQAWVHDREACRWGSPAMRGFAAGKRV